MIRFTLISAPGSGTQMLRSALNVHPNIAVSQGLFNPKELERRDRLQWQENAVYENWFDRIRSDNIQAIGSLLHRTPYHPATNVGDRHWQHARDLHTRSISLMRINTLRQYLSVDAACQLKMWSCIRPRPADKLSEPIEVDPNIVVAFGEYQNRLFGEIDTNMPAIMVVHYERLCTNWGPIMDQIQEHLEVKVYDLKPFTHQQETRPLQECITNYEEIVEFCYETGYEHWLDEHWQDQPTGSVASV